MRRQLYRLAATTMLVAYAASISACAASRAEAPEAAFSAAPSMAMGGVATESMAESVSVSAGGDYRMASDDVQARGMIASAQAARAPRAAGAPPPAPPPAAPASPPSQTPGGPPAPKAAPDEAAVMRGPLLIYTAQIVIAVFEVKASLGQVEALARELGGFMSRRDDMAITIRVPVNRFDEAVKRVEAIGDMLHRNVTAEDVTEQFRDLDVRLKSARAVQERLTQLLARAAKVEESIAIERELDRVTAEIDQIEGRMKFLKDRAAYSTLTVSFQPKSTDTSVRTPFRLPGAWLDELGLGRLLQL